MLCWENGPGLLPAHPNTPQATWTLEPCMLPGQWVNRTRWVLKFYTDVKK